VPTPAVASSPVLQIVIMVLFFLNNFAPLPAILLFIATSCFSIFFASLSIISLAEIDRRLGTLFRHSLEEEMHTHFARRWTEREMAMRNAVLDQIAPHTEPAPRRGIVAAALGALGAGYGPREVEEVILRLIDEFYLTEHGERIVFAVPLYAQWWTRWGR
jgi:hypothetical protein